MFIASSLHITSWHIVNTRPALQGYALKTILAEKAPRWGARAPLKRLRAGYALQPSSLKKRPVGARARR